jgi:DNA-directed RNA polymerase II subunit RPB1
MNYENTRIDKIEFKILTNNDVLKYSVISDGGIDIAESYENNEPKRGGLIDSRLGTTNHNIICATCNLNDVKCPGHFGHIELTEKVFNYAYFKHVKALLECICI